ncbi:MAG: pyridoxal-dependent decarboxylase [Gemmatimonadota bacterium]
MADYLDQVGLYPVLSRVSPGDIRAALPPAAPHEGERFDEIFRDFRDIVMPGVTHWNHPAFFGYFAVTGSGPGILGEMFAAALNVNAMVWRSSPAGTELEEHTLDWIRSLLGLPEDFEGVINDTASHSSLYALAAAREARLPEAREDGLAGAPRGRIYASVEAHSSIDKAGITLGFGRTGVRRVQSDDDFRVKPAALREAIEDDLRNGIRPIAVVATVGTTSTSSVEPVEEIADIAEEFGLWLHVDAAYAGSAAMVPELRPLFRGWERADSIVMNPHKWLFTPVDCSILYCRRPEMLKAAFSLTPEYLKTSEQGVARNLMDYGVALGRRFRALKLWFVLRYFGSEGIIDRIREHVRLARRFADGVDAHPEWIRMAQVPFSTVVFRYAPEGVSGEEQDALNHRILERVNATGEAFLSHTRLKDRITLRLSIGNLRTEESHVERTWELLQEAAGALREERASRSECVAGS